VERALTDFIRALRAAGADVSPAEAIDAARTLSLIGFDDRQRMKDSLAVVLAKSEDEKRIHDRMFEVFFSRRATPASSSLDASKGKALDTTEAPGESFLDLALSQDNDRLDLAIEHAAAAVGVDNIRFVTQTSYLVRRMLEEMGVDQMDSLISAKLGGSSRGAKKQASELIAARDLVQKKARAFVDQRFELFGKSATEEFMNEIVVNREITQLGLRDMERMRALVARMAKRLAARHSRRKKVRNRGQLDMRHTMRANAGHDGVPFDLVWKLKRKDRPKIIAICDVSGSVSSYARFLLLFLYALKGEVADLGAFAFSARLKDIRPELETMSFEGAMEKVVKEVGSGGTDYGQALADFREHHWDLIDRRTTILMLGDGRSNRADPRLDLFQEAADRAKRIVWLNPEQQNRWGSGDSCALEYLPFCTSMTYCSNAVDLERALDDVLMAYD
jgi:uncharacterized protein